MTRRINPEEHLEWNSPIPYLFGGLAIAMGLIAAALIYLVCCNRKTFSIAADHRAEEKEKSPSQVDGESRVVVVMAADGLPSFLAVEKAAPLN